MSCENDKSPLRIILGPTASGKESLALYLAEAEGADIISVDSMKIYKGMDIGTATPSTVSLENIRHWCINIADPALGFSVAEYLSAAESAIAACESDSRAFIFSGGTALYYKALTEGLFDGPQALPEVRLELEAYAREHGLDALHERLRRHDPVSADRIHANDMKRVVRALEVVLSTGVPISEQQTQFGQQRTDRRILMAGLLWDRPVLHERINRRVDIMVEKGLLEEARALFESDPPVGPQAGAAVGYAEFFAHFRGEHDLDTAIELVKRNTRRLAKSQMTWFRKFPCEWIEMKEELAKEDLAERVLKIWKAES